MAITLEANYSKKVGLPGYSSHQFMLTLRTEISDLTQVQNESARLYKQLQDGVDTSLKEIGWLPEPASNAHPRNGNGNGHNRTAPREEPWKCSPKQQALILKIVEEQQLDKNAIEQLALDRFGRGVRQLNKLEASGLIEELFEKNKQRQPAPAR
jgi:hypothetical protein